MQPALHVDLGDWVYFEQATKQSPMHEMIVGHGIFTTKHSDIYYPVVDKLNYLSGSL